MVNASYINAATKHKQAKQGSLGTELAPQAKYMIEAPSLEIERCLRLTLCTINKYAGA